MNRNNFFFTYLILITLISLPLVSAVSVSDLNLTLVNPPFTLNKDLNFQLDWTQQDANAIYWDFSGDVNITQNAIGRIVPFDCFAGDNTDLNSLYDWFYNTDAAGVAVVVNNQCNLNVINTGTGGTSSLQDDENVSVAVLGDTVRVDFVWRGSFVNAGDWAPFRFGFARTSGINLTTDTIVVSVTDAGNDAYEIRVDNVATGDTGNLSVGDTYGFLLTRTGSVGIYDWNFFVNSVSVHNGVNADLGSDVLHMVWNQVAAPTGVGDVNSVLDENFIFENGVIRPPFNIPLTSPQFQSHTFTTTGIKSVVVTVQTDINITTTFDFNITGFLNITVFDENVNTVISGATIDFNSGTYITDINGNINIPLADLTTGEFIISVDVNTDFPERQFIFDLNQFSGKDLNLLMLQTVHGSSRDFKIFQPDETTPITNSLIEWQRSDGVDNGIAQKTRTNTSGEITFFGQQDANYTLQITDTVSDVNRTYTGTLLTVKIPLDAEDLVIQLTPFSVTVGGLATQSFTSLSDDLVFRIYSDTVDLYNISIDFNTDYFGTSINIQTKGGAATEEFQSYLIQKTGNIEATIFTINNPEGRVSVSGIRIDSFTDINGTSTLVESKFSDGTGQAIFHFVQGNEYTLNFYDADGDLIMSKTIEANDTQYFAYLELGDVSISPVPSLQVAVNWNPIIGSVVPASNGNVSFWQLIRPTNGTVGDVNVFISHITDSNIIFNQVFTINSNADANIAFDLNVAGFDDSFPLKISLQIFDSDSQQVGAIRTNSYSFKDTGFPLATERAKDALGQFGVTLVSLIIIVVGVGFFTSRAVGEDMNVPAFGAVVLLSIVFVMIGWIRVDTFVSALFFGVGLTLWSVKK